MYLPQRRPSPMVLFESDLASLYASLNDSHKLKILLERAADILKENMFAGEKIKKKQIPKYYITNYDVHILYRLRVDECRIIYTLLSDSEGLKTIVLECFTDHKSYAKRFGYDT